MEINGEWGNNEVLPYMFHSNTSNEVSKQLFMYGDKDLPSGINRNIIELTLYFIHKSSQFYFIFFRVLATVNLKYNLAEITFDGSSLWKALISFPKTFLKSQFWDFTFMD